MLQKTQNTVRSSISTLYQGWWWIDQNKLGIARLPENSIRFALKALDIMLIFLVEHSLATVRGVECLRILDL